MLFLEVDYDIKDKVKRLGARWNPEIKKWYVEKKENFNEWNLKYKNTILNTCEKLATAVNEAVRDGYRPIVIGGDHSIALGSISGVSLEKEIGVIWIDAHGDMNTDESTITGNIHGMPLALLQGAGDRDLVNCFYEGAKIDSKNVVILGARDLDFKEREIIDQLGVKVIYHDEVLQKGLDNILEEIREYLQIDNLHISFDVDSVNPELAPGVSTPVRNGFTTDEIFQTFKYLFKNYSITSTPCICASKSSEKQSHNPSGCSFIYSVVYQFSAKLISPANPNTICRYLLSCFPDQTRHPQALHSSRPNPQNQLPIPGMYLHGKLPRYPVLCKFL